MAMSSNYNARPRAAEVLVDGEHAISCAAASASTTLFADGIELG
jgi:hypothetical protein